MDQETKTRLLRQMLPQVAPELLDDPESELESTGMAESVGMEAVESTQRGLEKIRSTGTLDTSESEHLEAIIHRQFRPAAFIRNDDFQKPPAPWEHLGTGKTKRLIKSAILSIGRIELPGDTLRSHGGTGFVVGPKTIMTNRHVAEIFSSGLGVQGLSFKRGKQSAINFRREKRPSNEPDLKVEKVLMIHPFWDMALLQVDGLSDDREPLTLSVQHPDDLNEREVVIIGYPAFDPRNDRQLQDDIFGPTYNVKRLQPGFVRPRRQIRSFENRVQAITHDASTLGGNSGSAVIDVKTGEVVALHFAGRYLDANFAVPSYELARDQRVVDANVNFADKVAPTTEWAARWRIADQSVEAIKLPKTGNQSAQQQATTQNQQVQVQGNAVTWTIPLSVTITFGTPQVSPNVAAAPPAPPASAEVEGLFGESASEIVARAYNSFSATSLSDPGFSWRAAITAGAASNLAYDDEPEVKRVCRQKWNFDTCEFIQVNDTECFVASNSRQTLLSFRGTAGTADWFRDLTVFSTDTAFGSLHEGFFLGVKQVKDEIVQVLERVDAKNKSLVLTGHSLGGALATIAAAELGDEYPITGIYTYGQPAVGKEDFQTFMQKYAGKLYRVINDDDVITKVPPGYVHVGRVFRFGFFGGVSHESTASAAPEETEPAMATELEFRAMQARVADGDFNDTEGPISEGIFPGVSFLDHKMTNYLKKTLKQLD